MSDTAVFVKRSKRPPQDIARRKAADESTTSASTSTEAESQVVKAGRKREANPLIQSTASYKSKRARLEAEESEDEKDFRINFSSARNVNTHEGAEKIVTAEEAASLTENGADDGLYHGSKAYKSQLPKASAKYTAVAGPANVRQITITDYQPDVCKDYKGVFALLFSDLSDFLEIFETSHLR